MSTYTDVLNTIETSPVTGEDDAALLDSIQKAFGLDEDQAYKVWWLLEPGRLAEVEGSLTYDELDSDLYRLCGNRHRPVHSRREWSVDRSLDLINHLIGGFGVEPLEHEENWVSKYYGQINGLFVNMGDPYKTTVVYDTSDETFHVTCWGDWLEGKEEDLGIGAYSGAYSGDDDFDDDDFDDDDFDGIEF